MIIDKALNVIMKSFNLLINLIDWLVKHWFWILLIVIIYIIFIKLFKGKQEPKTIGQEETEEEKQK